MRDTPKGMRAHIAIVGRRNAGKSSLVNALTKQDVCIISATPGTTTDPVEKTMELASLGPVVFIDTAGTDDEGEMGKMRVERTQRILQRADMAILVTDGNTWDQPENELAQKLRDLRLPFIIARNKLDLVNFEEMEKWRLKHALTVPVLDISAKSGLNVDNLADALCGILPETAKTPLSADLLPAGGVAILVIPLDTGAPKGRLILPQAQTIRDMLDHEMICVSVTETACARAMAQLRVQPDLVICDSQIVGKVAKMTPVDIPLTTFSILMARNKGNLEEFARGAGAIHALKKGDEIIVQEACSHHPQADDIGRVKIPRLLGKIAGGELSVKVLSGKEMQAYEGSPALIVHCGGCVITRRQMLYRQKIASDCGWPMTNYGMAISAANGVLERVLSPFPKALAMYWKQKNGKVN